MFKKSLVALLATSALAAAAPGASADAPTTDCAFDALQQEDATGQNYEGVARGFVAHSAGDAVSVQCYVKVNGGAVSATPTGTGTGAATTVGRVTFAAGDVDVVALCASGTTSHGWYEHCAVVTNLHVPPQEVVDVLANGLDVVDAVVAPVLDTVDSGIDAGLDVVDQARVPWEALPRVPVVRAITHATDYILIKDHGTGPRVTTRGAFSKPDWWTCTTSTSGPVSVRCIAAPVWQSGIIWKCDVMDVTANAQTNHRNGWGWGRGALDDMVFEAQRMGTAVLGSRRAPNVPDPNDIRWGQAAGFLACDSTTLETDTASQASPKESATATFGAVGVTQFVCEARRARGVAQAPIAPYSVNCLDPGAPGIG